MLSFFYKTQVSDDEKLSHLMKDVLDNHQSMDRTCE